MSKFATGGALQVASVDFSGVVVKYDALNFPNEGSLSGEATAPLCIPSVNVADTSDSGPACTPANEGTVDGGADAGDGVEAGDP
jgi:hypothetical protein